LEGLQADTFHNRIAHITVQFRDLTDQAQAVKDQVLSDPRQEGIWREERHRNKMLKRQRRHDEAMEAAAEAEAAAKEAEAESAREGVEIMKQQRNAERITAGATVIAAVQTRKLAKATQEINERQRSLDRH